MATNEELQVQIDALREAMQKIAGLEVQDARQSAARLSGPQLRVRFNRDFKAALDHFDEVRGEGG